MARHTTAYRRRGGFTLVEMLVSTALIIFVLLIITTVFTTGIGALRALRGAGHLQDEARHAVSTLRRDLAAPHFGRETDALHGPSLSQQRLDLYDWTPPKEGFFRIWQGSLPTLEDTTGIVTTDANGDGKIDYDDVRVLGTADGDGMISYRAINHYLHFTVRAEPNTAQGNGRDQLSFTNSVYNALYDPTNPMALLSQKYTNVIRPAAMLTSSHLNGDNFATIFSPWTEVAYFLRPSGQQAGSTTLYTLYRRRRVLLDIKSPTTVASNPVPYTSGSKPVVPIMSDVSLYEPQPGNTAGNAYFNTPSDITVPYRRLSMAPVTMVNPSGPMPATAAGTFPAGQQYRSLFDDYPNQNVGTSTVGSPGGDDILLENVLSFEIKASWDIPTDQRIRRTANGVNPPTPYFLQPNPPNVIPIVLNPDYPFDNLPVPQFGIGNTVLTGQGARVFDTWRGEDYVDPSVTGTGKVLYSQWKVNNEFPNNPDPQLAAVTIPLCIRVKAIQIRIRVWDVKTQQTRQVTVIQDL